MWTPSTNSSNNQPELTQPQPPFKSITYRFSIRKQYMGKTLFDKIWDKHVVTTVENGPTQLYIDRHYCHEVTSPQAFQGLRNRKLSVLRPANTFCMPDHNIPTLNQEQPIADAISRNQVETLTRNAQEFGLSLFGLGHPKNGVIHVVGPENGLTQPGMTIVCGDLVRRLFRGSADCYKHFRFRCFSLAESLHRGS